MLKELPVTGSLDNGMAMTQMKSILGSRESYAMVFIKGGMGVMG
jgi:hypothetical protein